ncbi:MAG: ATP-binding protein [Gemmatimonadales bacterium]|nr:MAG: ATP-binding protein [Gemmatimonadales bacterium]
MELAPVPLRSHRKDRYRGSDRGRSVSDFLPPDREHLYSLYRALQSLYQYWLDHRPEPDPTALARHNRAFASPPLVGSAEALGTATLAAPAGADAALRRAIHDLRGGALFALRLYGELGEEELEEDPDLLRAGVFLARDQAKIMRHLLVDLDPEGRARDEEERIHSLDDVVAKWQGFEARTPPAAPVRRARVSVRSEWSGGLASCCLEASAVDRILYNLVNNALRFTVDGEIALRIVPVPESALRWVVTNAISPDQAGWLDRNAGHLGARLFHGGRTRGGTGTGLTTPGELVASAFGLRDLAEAVGEGYLGARWSTDQVHIWFHWPRLEG